MRRPGRSEKRVPLISVSATGSFVSGGNRCHESRSESWSSTSPCSRGASPNTIRPTQGGGDAGASQGYITDLPAGWRVRCSQGQAASLDACGELLQATGPEAERLAFELNVVASDTGLLPPGLGELHFSHGQYAGWSVYDLRDAFDDPSRDAAKLIDLAASVNRAFVRGVDAGALARWITTPLCGGWRTVEGPESARCGLIDAECARGRYVESLGCCTADMAPPGALCSEGVCDARGACVSGPPTGAGQGGRLARFEVLSNTGEPWPWHLRDGAVRVSSLADGELASLGDSEPRVDEENYEAWEPRWGGNLGRPIAEFTDALPTDRRVRLGLSEPGTAARVASAFDAPGGASALYLDGEQAQICVVRDRTIDELGPVMSDCTTGGAVLIQCPGESEAGTHCAHEGGRTVIRGEKLSLAFAPGVPQQPPTDGDPIQPPPPPTDGDPIEPPPSVDGLFFDIIPLVFPDRVCGGFGCIELIGGHTLPVSIHFNFPRPIPPWPPLPPIEFGCDLGDDCRGRTFCFGLPDRPPNCLCLGRAEICNGRDDDCDGEVDEETDDACQDDDGVGCTIEFCVAGGCRPARGDVESSMCSEVYCAPGICNGQVPSWVDPSLPRTPVDPNGCQEVRNHDFCENIYDRCACNGASVCSPNAAATQGADAVFTGCAEIPSFGSPCEMGEGGDANACTQELCCEPNAGCRYLRDRPPPPALPSGSVTILSADEEICTSNLVWRRPGGYPVNGVRPECVRAENYASDADRELIHCNDENPCTLDSCDNQFTGACRYRNITRAVPPRDTAPPLEVATIFGGTEQLDQGCFGTTPEECGIWRCREEVIPPHGGPYPRPIACQLLPADGATAGTTTSQCGGDNPHHVCLEDSCDGFGSCVRDVSTCEDGLACTAQRCERFGDTGVCLADVISGCLIGGVCVAEGALDPTDSRMCRICDRMANQRQWSLRDLPRCGADI